MTIMPLDFLAAVSSVTGLATQTFKSPPQIDSLERALAEVRVYDPSERALTDDEKAKVREHFGL